MSGYFEELVQTISSLKEQAMRSLLTMIGIIVGVMAIIGIVSIGQAGKNSIKKDLESFGTNIAAMWPERRENSVYKPLNKYDAEFLRHLAFIESVSPIYYLYKEVRYNDFKTTTMVNGVNEGYFKLNNRTVSTGRLFTEKENTGSRRVCVITEGIKNDIQKKYGIVNPVGRIIKIGDFPFYIIGVLKKPELKSFLSTLMSEERDVYVPENALKITFGNFDIRYLIFGLKEGVKPEKAKNSLEFLFRLRKGKNTYYGMNFLESQVNVFTGVMNKITFIITLIGALSLFVGGVGIMNIMFISVTERTREIGIRKALGASQNAIMRQFLSEAVIISFAGSTLGVLVGILITILIESAIKWGIYISALSVVISYVFSTLIGITFGLLPAKKAASLNPIDALRYE